MTPTHLTTYSGLYNALYGAICSVLYSVLLHSVQYQSEWLESLSDTNIPIIINNNRTANYFTPSLHHASVTISPRFHHDSAFCMEILRHDYHDRTTLELRVYYALHARTTRHALTTIFLNMFKTSPRAPRSSRPTTLERDVTTTPLRRDALSLRRDAISPRSHHD
jgi:hypothetical protein